MSSPIFPTDTDPVAEIARLLEERGESLYGGEAVTQREHALQAAMFAEKSGASPALITASLLHDIGHLLHDLPEDAPDHDIDDRHEELAARWLETRFGPDVVEPVRLHVPAKRYLCSTDPSYFGKLSPPSVRSLELQGGPMSAEEVSAFDQSPHRDAAVRLRRFDEAAKVVGLETPPVAHFLGYVRAVVAPASR